MNNNLDEIISILESKKDFSNINFGGVFYRQIAVIKHEDAFFYILSPLIDIDGVSDDNLALAYTCEEEALVAVTNEEQCREIFRKYYELFAFHKYGEVLIDGSILKSEIVYTCYTLENDKKLCDYKKAAIARKKYNQISKLRREFKSVIKGQDAAIEQVIKVITQKQDADGPLVIGLFGPRGTGKTTLVKAIATASDASVIYIPGSEYSDEQASAQSLFGYDPNYKAGYSGLIPNYIFSTPGKKVVHLDEIDQFAPSVREKLYPILSEGIMTDGYLGIRVSVKDVNFVVISNNCNSIYENGGINMADVPIENIAEALSSEVDTKGRRMFTPALISRLVANGSLLIYNNLGYDSKKEIIKGEIKRLAEKQKDVDYIVDVDKLSELILFNRPEFDARELKGEVRKLFSKIEKSSSEIVCEENSGYIDTIKIDMDDYLSNHKVSLLLAEKKHKLLFFGELELDDIIDADIIWGSDDFDSHFTENNEVESIVIDATCSLENARRIFKGVKDRTNLPVYVFSRNNISRTRLAEFIEKGATDIYTSACGITLEKWFSKITDGLKIGSLCRVLIDRALHVDYDIDYSVEGHTLLIKLCSQLRDDITTYKDGKLVSLDKESLAQIACHESGHAICSWALLGNAAVERISLLPRGKIGGFVSVAHRGYMRCELDMRNEICTLLAGRVAETIIYDKDVGTNTSAISDLSSATQIAADMITKFGMAGAVSVGGDPDRKVIDEIIKEEYRRAEEILLKNRDLIVKLSDILCKNRVISKKEFERIVLC